MSGEARAGTGAPAERAGLALAILLCALLAWPLRHYVTDDTFIHLQYAHHLARGDGLVFNPGERVYGATSPLWVALLADAMAMGADGLVAGKLLGAAATLAAVLLWFALARRTLAHPWLPALSTICWAGHAWMLRWSLSGMETPLAVCLVLAGALAFASSRPWGERGGWASLLWALAALARPECALLLPIWGVLLIADRGPRAGALAAGALWPGALVLGLWLAFARAWFGSFWPNTLAAKTAGGEGPGYALELLLRQGGIVATTDGVLAAVLMAALAARAMRGERWDFRPSVRWLPWVWLVAVPLLYMVRGVTVVSRYLVPLLPILAWAAWRSLDGWLAGTPAPAGEPRPSLAAGPARGDGRQGRVLAVAIASLALAQNLWAWQRVVRPQVDSFTAGMHASLIPWGRWFAEHTASDAVVAAPDIGALGYGSQRRVLDLAGLVTPAMVPILRTMSQEDATARFAFVSFARPDYLVDRAPRAWDLEQRSAWAASLVRLGHATLPNLGVARPAPAVYSFYRIDWAAYDSLARSR